MARYLLCLECEKHFTLHPADRQNGFRERRVYVSLNSSVPKNHGFTMNGVFEPMSQVICDHCSKVIAGDFAIGVTHWCGERDFPEWETEYGTPVPWEAVEMKLKMTK